MNTRRQFVLLYRDYLFRVVDPELLSSHGTGDASPLLLQIVSLLLILSVAFTVSVPSFRGDASGLTILGSSWTFEHFLIATTMVTVGVLATLMWGSMFPDRLDVLVLAPLPVRPSTILWAKLAAIVTAIVLAIVALHIVVGVVWPPLLNTVDRPMTIPTLAPLPAMPPVGAAGIEAVLLQDLAHVRQTGVLAPGAGGGIAVGIRQRGEHRLFAIGAARPDSLFQIGSVTKPLTGLVLARLVEERQVAFDEPLRRLVPSIELAVPTRSEITVGDLVTHRSGLPGMPGDYRPIDPSNPVRGFDVNRMRAYLSRRGVDRSAAEPFRYSNLGYGLLGHALEERTGVDYETLMRTLVTDPLGMRDTVVTPTAAQRGRALQGHDFDRRRTPAWDLDALVPAGGLWSTAQDLLIWLDANLRPERTSPGTLASALRASHRPRAIGGGDERIGLAWMVDPTTGRVSHTGAIVGFTADVWFNPRTDTAVVVLANTGPGTVVSATTIADYIRARLSGATASALEEVTIAERGTIWSGAQLFAAHWAASLAAGLFVLFAFMGVQGVAVAALPRRYSQRLSPALQLAMFCLCIGLYFLQPMAVGPGRIADIQRTGLLATSPSHWFLGLFHVLSGSPVMLPLAHAAAAAFAGAAALTAVALVLAYVRTFRRIASEPDITPGRTHRRWLPPFGRRPQTAIVQFVIRTLARSPQHRVITAFYWGLGFAIAMIIVKVPRAAQLAAPLDSEAWREASVPLVISSLLMLMCTVLGARLASAMPRDLGANWIFRVLPVRGGAGFVAARRRALAVIGVAPVLALSTVAFSVAWPWPQALMHVAVLALTGLVLVELAIGGTQKIPFTCAYLPGRTRIHVTLYAIGALLVPLTVIAAQYERDALIDQRRLAALFAVLLGAWLLMRVRTAWLIAPGAEAAFDEEGDAPVSLGVWDTRREFPERVPAESKPIE
ncbi:serine hydrolase domain-containing protein [Luteitalea sp.]